MSPALVNWESYYNFYKSKNNDPNSFEFYYDDVNSTMIASAILELFLYELISVTNFSQFSLSTFLANLPVNGAYDTKIFWEVQNSNLLIARIKKDINITTDPKYPIIKLRFNLPISLSTYTDKVAIPFENNIYHETNINCPLCFQIDKEYNEVFNNPLPEDIVQRKLKNLEQFLVNGYELLTVYEKNGYGSAKLFYKEKISKIKKYESLHGNDFEPDDIRLIHSRWCKNCGSRKPDIYDRSREVDE